ncbi:MAG TPA: twin-arginine translocation signal domain-containing protein [Actinomycetota bacterium]
MHEQRWHGPISRRAFMRTAAGATGVALGSSLWRPGLAWAAKGSTEPSPIPGGTELPFGFFHFFFPGHKMEPSTITDFNGFVGVAELEGTGVGTDPDTGDTIPLVFGVDNRFMEGEYVAVDGSHHQGLFGFI